MGIPIKTYTSYIDVHGYEYEARVNYIRTGNEVEIHGILLKNEEGEWVDLPFLVQVDEDMVNDILLDEPL